MNTQCGYDGVLGTAHLRAVARAALQAHGLALPAEESRRGVEARVRLGVWLRDTAVPGSLSPASAEAYRRALTIDDYSRERLPHTTSFGHGLTAAIHRLSGGPEQAADDVALLGGLFNAAVAAIDHVVDDNPGGAELFDLLDPALVAGIFIVDSDFDDRVSEMLPALAGQPDWCLALLLVAACTITGRRMLRVSGNEHAWRQLGELAQRLFAAERMTLGDTDQDASIAGSKSELPVQMMLGISMLARPAGDVPPPEVPAQVERLGKVLSLADDLVDLAEDARSGAPNTLLAGAAPEMSRAGTSFADADLYDIADAGGRELVRLVGPAPAELRRYQLEHAGTFADLGHGLVLLWAGHDEIPGQIEREQEDGTAKLAAGPAQAAVAMLLAQRAQEYAEAAHHLRFPRLAGHGQHYETHPAVLSFRAVAFDALLDARDVGLEVPDEVLNAEAIAILRMKHRLVRGGWNYIPEVPELPPDADDLGQVLQVLTRLGGSPLAATCDEPVRMVLDGMRADGGFSTWVLDRRGRSAADDDVRAYLAVMGGWGVHPEVVANLLCGLILADPVRYRTPLRRAARYLESAQNQDGTWSSRWYAGPFYGTYRAGAVLAALGAAPEACARATARLVQLQNTDGGWGLRDNEGENCRTDELSTALAVLALLGLGMAPDTATVRRGVERLLSEQAEDGGWPAHPWIVFPTLDGPVSYGSRSMTTAFALKALAAAATGRVIARARRVR